MARLSVFSLSLVVFVVSVPLIQAQTVYPTTGFSGPFSQVRTATYGFGHQKVRGHAKPCGDCMPCANTRSLWSDFCHADRGCGFRSCESPAHCCDSGCATRIGHRWGNSKPCGHATNLWDNFCCEPRTYSLPWPKCGRRCGTKSCESTCDVMPCCETLSCEADCCESDCCDAGCGKIKARARQLFFGGLKLHRHGKCGCGEIVEMDHGVEMQIEVEPSPSDQGGEIPVPPQPSI
jgi:hypothetical protein